MKKTKIFKKLIISVLALSMVLSNFCTAFADTVDEIQVTVTTDKEDYKSGEEVKFNVSVKNTNNFELISPKITFSLPEGLTINGKSEATFTLDSISANQTVDKDIKVTVAKTEVSAPVTGDSSNVIIYIVMAGIALTVITVLLITKKKKAVSVLMTVVLIAGLGISSIGIVASASTAQKTIEGKIPVTVDGEKKDIAYSFIYSVETEETTEGSTEASTEKPSEGSIEKPSEGSIETPTETPTEAPIETPAEAPTEKPSEGSTETPTGEYYFHNNTGYIGFAFTSDNIINGNEDYTSIHAGRAAGNFKYIIDYGTNLDYSSVKYSEEFEFASNYDYNSDNYDIYLYNNLSDALSECDTISYLTGLSFNLDKDDLTYAGDRTTLAQQLDKVSILVYSSDNQFLQKIPLKDIDNYTLYYDVYRDGEWEVKITQGDYIYGTNEKGEENAKIGCKLNVESIFSLLEGYSIYDYLTSIKIYTNDTNYLLYQNGKDFDWVVGSYSFAMDSDICCYGSDVYNFTATVGSGREYNGTVEITGTGDITEDTYWTEDELREPNLEISGIPTEPVSEPFYITLTTDIPVAVFNFNGKTITEGFKVGTDSDGNTTYSADFLVERDGTYYASVNSENGHLTEKYVTIEAFSKAGDTTDDIIYTDPYLAPDNNSEDLDDIAE